MFIKLFAAILPLAATVSAVNHQVVLGMNGTLTFTPPAIQAVLNDTVEFVFMAKNHSIRQGTFNDPCSQLPGGFQASFNQVVQKNQTDNFPTITINVETTSPIWVSCPQPGPPNHCQNGMVFAINANANHTFDQFQQNAINSANTSSSGNVSSTGSGANIISSLSSSSDPAPTNGTALNGATHYKVPIAMSLLGVVASGMLLL